MTATRTPNAERLHVALFGRRNAGKSSLLNALVGQDVAIVSPQPGTTTDPVDKAMELLPLGPVLLTDTPGLDDEGALGALRVQRGLQALTRTDVALLLVEAGTTPGPLEEQFVQRAREGGTSVVVVTSKCDGGDSGATAAWARDRGLPHVATSAATGAGLGELRAALVAAAPQDDAEPPLLTGLVQAGDLVVLVVPIDQAAPKGRLIMPQVLTLRELLDRDASALVVKERELAFALSGLPRSPRLVITDSQAFLKVAADTPNHVPMTSFSILMARARGDLVEFVAGARAIRDLRPGDRVLIAEGCAHHRQGDDIGSVQIPRWLRQAVGGDLDFRHARGHDFPEDLSGYRLAVHCGGRAGGGRGGRARPPAAGAAGRGPDDQLRRAAGLRTRHPGPCAGAVPDGSRTVE
jgi:[FeFe] hydrogenase H-cluster maturation GTPase HydF